MPVSAHMESGHHIRNHGTSSLEHRSSPACVLDCRSSSASLPFGNRHCNSSFDFKYPSINNNQICSKVMCSVDRSFNSTLHVVTTSSGTGCLSAPYSDSSVISVSTSAMDKSPDCDSLITQSQTNSSSQEDPEVCANISQKMPSASPIAVSLNQSHSDSTNEDIIQNKIGSSDDTYDESPSIVLSKSSDSSFANESEQKSSTEDAITEKSLSSEPLHTISEMNNDDTDASHYSSKLENSSLSESYPSPNNQDPSSVDNTIESVLDKIRTGVEVEFDLNSRSQEVPTHSNDVSPDLNNSGVQQFYSTTPSIKTTSAGPSTVQWSQYKQSSPKESFILEESNSKFVNKSPAALHPSSSQIITNGADPNRHNPVVARNMNIPFSSYPRNQLGHNASRMPYNMFHQNSMYPHQGVHPVNHQNFMPNYNLAPNHFPNNSYQGSQNISFNNSGYYAPFNSSPHDAFYSHRGYERMVGPPSNNMPNSYLSKQNIPRQTFTNTPYEIYKSYGSHSAMYPYNQTRPVHSMHAYDQTSPSMQMFQPGYYSMDSNCSMKTLPHSTLKGMSRKRNNVTEKTKSVPQVKKRRTTDETIESDANSYETMYDELMLPNFQKCIQEPLVQPQLFLAIPKGGSYCSKNEVDEVEESSQFVLDKKKKYELTPFSLKLCLPNAPTKDDSYVFQSMKTCGNLLKLPSKPIFSKSVPLERSSTPDYLVSASPLNSDYCLESNSSFPSLTAFESISMENSTSRSRSGTPLLPVHPIQHSKQKSIESSCQLVDKKDLPAEKSLLELSNSSIDGHNNLENNSWRSDATEIKIFPRDSFFNGFCNSHDSSSAFFKPLGGYAEQSTSIPKLLKNMQIGKCEVCNTNIVDWQYVRRRDATGEDEKRFCSVLCLTNHVKKVQPAIMEPNEQDFSSEFIQELLIDSSSILSRILIKGPLPKIFKKPPKRILERQLPISCRDSSNNRRWKELRYKRFRKSIFPLKSSRLPENSEDILSGSPSLRIPDGIPDCRVCSLCQRTGDMKEKSAGRLINHDVDDWFHVNCALWCYEVYETISGALVDPNETSYTRAKTTRCYHCGEYGAGLPCYRSRCTCTYHIPCAQEAGCMFFTDRGMYCPMHKLAPDHPLHMPDISANRKIFLDRESNIVVGNAVLNYQNSKSSIIRSGALIVRCIGQLTHEEMLSGNFNDNTTIYPVGYKIVRIFWSTSEINKRCTYECSINSKNQQPIFIVRRLEKDCSVEESTAESPDLAWQPFLEKIAALREKAKLIRLYPHLLKGKDLFGLIDPCIIRACESLPNIEILPDYIFRYGRLQSITDNETPNQFCLSGAARLENRYTVELCHRSSRWARSRFAEPTNVSILQSNSTGRQNSMNNHLDYGAPHSKLSKLQLFKRLTSGYEWKCNVCFSPSKSRGMGVFAARSMEKHTMIIELVGELLRDQVALQRERFYKSKHRRDVILMRIEKGLVLDATSRGNLSRFIKHSCNPNCVAELLVIEGKPHIVLTAGRAIALSEELTFDYKVDQYAAENSWQFLEPYQGPPKIPCFCGASTCKKWIS